MTSQFNGEYREKRMKFKKMYKLIFKNYHEKLI